MLLLNLYKISVATGASLGFIYGIYDSKKEIRKNPRERNFMLRCFSHTLTTFSCIVIGTSMGTVLGILSPISVPIMICNYN